MEFCTKHPTYKNTLTDIPCYMQEERNNRIFLIKLILKNSQCFNSLFYLLQLKSIYTDSPSGQISCAQQMSIQLIIWLLFLCQFNNTENFKSYTPINKRMYQNHTQTHSLPADSQGLCITIDQTEVCIHQLINLLNLLVIQLLTSIGRPLSLKLMLLQ